MVKPTSVLRIQDVVFGLAAAEEERAKRPQLLLEGFFDAFGYVKEVAEGNKFLVLGPKGSGKSAIASRIELLAKEREGLFAATYQLGTFAFDAFTGVLPGTEAPESRYPSIWELLLLIALMESFSRDPHCKSTGTPSHSKVIDALRRLGLLPARDLTQLVKRTSSKEFKAGVPGLFEVGMTSSKESTSPDVKFLHNTLREVCCHTSPSGQHLLFIDGLDDILTRRGKQYEALAALIVATDRMNKMLRDFSISAKVVVLCRTDLFERLPGPNKNKIRQDNSVTLDWYQDARDLKSTNLVKLVNQRAFVCLGRQIDVFDEFLPPSLGSGQPTTKALLDSTRHTPRDIIQLMNRVRDFACGPTASDGSVWTALGKYSEDYLLNEVRDELSGSLSRDEIERVLQLLSVMGHDVFRFDQIRAAQLKDERFGGIDLMKTLELLFECSAIGNLRGRDTDERYRFTFRYRNRNAVFNPNEEIVVHRGLRKALNLTSS